MTNLFKLPTFSDDGHLRVVVETPRGSQAKLDYDPKLKTFTLAKSLLTGLSYPYDWGFIPATRAEDGDPLDVMVIHDAGTFPGLVLTCKIIGVLQVEQHRKGKKAERNDRVFAVPRDSHAEKDLSDVRDLTSAKREELEKFFIATDELEDKQLKILGWKGPKAARALAGCASGRGSHLASHRRLPQWRGLIRWQRFHPTNKSPPCGDSVSAVGGKRTSSATRFVGQPQATSGPVTIACSSVRHPLLLSSHDNL
jgi:inorganic pyrophosphatase